MDYYSILQVETDASPNQITRAYKSLAKKYHPDKNRDEPVDAHARFKCILEAYTVLSDRTKRMDYDKTYSNRKRQFDAGAGYDVAIDEMGISIHGMFSPKLADITKAFATNLCAIIESEAETGGHSEFP